MSVYVTRVGAREVLERLKAGERIITCDLVLDAIAANCQDDEAHEIRTIPNHSRVGVHDQYIAWIGESAV